MAQGPKPGHPRIRLLLLLTAALVLAGAAALMGRGGDGVPDAKPVGLFTSLPILWRETQDLSGLLTTDAPPHWALGAIEARGRLRPLDTLAGQDGKLPLPAGALLVMAQPRPLSPLENVALDDWVRGGGRLMLFADPMLTSHSAFALGDRRRRQDIVLLSPILSRWGLELHFDESQPFGEHEIALFGTAMPVNLPGRFAADNTKDCTLEANGLAAHCRIGAGEVLAIADAALLEDGTAGDEPGRRAMFGQLLAVLVD